MWVLWVVAIVIFSTGCSIFFERRESQADAHDTGRAAADQGFAGLVLMLIGVLIAMLIK
jgi:hypothetical protein